MNSGPVYESATLQNASVTMERPLPLSGRGLQSLTSAEKEKLNNGNFLCSVCACSVTTPWTISSMEAEQCEDCQPSQLHRSQAQHMKLQKKGANDKVHKDSSGTTLCCTG